MFNLLAWIQRFNLHRFSVLFVVISCLPVLLAGFTRFIENLIPASKLKLPIGQDFPLLDGLSDYLSPEPVERAIYLSCLVFLPIFLALITPVTHPRPITNSRWGNHRFDFVLYVVTTVMLILPLPFSRAFQVVIGKSGSSSNTSIIFALVSILFSCLFCLLLMRYRFQLHGNHRLASRISWKSTILCFSFFWALLCVLSFRIFGLLHLNTSAIWSMHLEVVLSTIAQVQAGRTLLVDIPSQYGLFPQILSQVFRFLPSGVGSITLVFGILQIICLMIVLYALSRYVKNPLVFGIGSLALLMVTSGVGQLFGYRFEPLPDPYFQYWPIRFVMPSISLIVVLHCFSHLTWRSIFVLSIFNALSLFWNLDSGVAIIYAECMLFLLLSILGFKAARRLGGWPPALHLAAVGVVPIASLIFYGAAVLSLGLFSGRPINPEWISGYQSVFYSLGFFMIPMPAKPGAWHTMISVYLIALSLGLSLASDGFRTERILPFLYIPLLGAGLFVYYQGRSHFFNLVSVSWPLIFVATVLVDWHLRGVRQKMISPFTLPLPIAGLACLLVPAMALIAGLPILFKAGLRFPFEQKHAYYFPSKILQSELELVRRNCQGDPRQCLLLIKRQGIYAVEAKTASAFLGPSPIELLLKKDFLRMKREIRDGRYPKILLAAGSEQEMQHLHLDSDDLRMYRFTQTNKERTVKVLERW